MKTWKTEWIGSMICVGIIVPGFVLPPNIEAQETSKPKSLKKIEPNSASGEIVYNTIPEDMNRKGLFFISKYIVKKEKIKSIKTIDFLYDKSEKLINRNRGDFAEFDSSGNMISFEGNIDQGPSVKVEFSYDINGNNIEKTIYLRKNNKYQFMVKIDYKYDENNNESEHIAYNQNGKVIGRRVFKYDKKGNKIEEAKVDPASNKITRKTVFKYDAAGNLMETSLGDIKTEYKYSNKRIDVIQYFPNGQVRVRKKYRFDDHDNVIEFYRESGDGNYWDRFAYKIGDQGLPIEKTWSRLEFIVQEPYELTKFKYENYQLKGKMGAPAVAKLEPPEPTGASVQPPMLRQGRGKKLAIFPEIILGNAAEDTGIASKWLVNSISKLTGKQGDSVYVAYSYLDRPKEEHAGMRAAVWKRVGVGKFLKLLTVPDVRGVRSRGKALGVDAVMQVLIRTDDPSSSGVSFAVTYKVHLLEVNAPGHHRSQGSADQVGLELLRQVESSMAEVIEEYTSKAQSR